MSDRRQSSAKPSVPSANAPQSDRWQSFVLFGSAIVLLAGGILLKVLPGIDAGSREFTSGAMLKVAFVAILAWIALPQLRKIGWEQLQGTGLVVILIVGILIAVKPRYGAIAAAVAIGGFVTLSLLRWGRRTIFNGDDTGTISRNTGKIEKNPTRR